MGMTWTNEDVEDYLANRRDQYEAPMAYRERLRLGKICQTVDAEAEAWVTNEADERFRRPGEVGHVGAPRPEDIIIGRTNGLSESGSADVGWPAEPSVQAKRGQNNHVHTPMWDKAQERVNAQPMSEVLFGKCPSSYRDPAMRSVEHFCELPAGHECKHICGVAGQVVTWDRSEAERQQHPADQQEGASDGVQGEESSSVQEGRRAQDQPPEHSQGYSQEEGQDLAIRVEQTPNPTRTLRYNAAAELRRLYRVEAYWRRYAYNQDMVWPEELR